MANCRGCGIELALLNRGRVGFCKKCDAKMDDKTIEQATHENRELDLKIEAIVLTTETAPNLNIKSRVGIIMADADCAFDVAMVKNKDALLSNLKSEAHTIGANAVVGVTFNMIETYSASIGIGKVNTFKLIAYGTAVIIETEEGAL